MTDPFTAPGKNKKKNELPPPERISTHFTKSAPSKYTLPKPQRIQAPKVKPVVKPVRPKAKQQHQQAQAQAPVYKNEDFQFSTNVDNAGVNIAVWFQGTHIYQFLLPVTDYEFWQKMGNSWTSRYQYVQTRIPLTAFMNDNALVDAVIKTIVNVLDTRFTEARKRTAQEAQAQARQAQAQAYQAQQQQRRRY